MLRLPITHACERRDARNAAPSALKLHNRLHDHSSFNFRLLDIRPSVHLCHIMRPCQEDGGAGQSITRHFTRDMFESQVTSS